MNTNKIIEINSIFTPSAPVDNPLQFIGRDLQREYFRRAISSPGRHIILYGERGVGKTSLLNIATKEINTSENISCVFHRCSHRNTFNDIVATFLGETGQLFEKKLTKVKKTEKILATLKTIFANAGAESTTEKENSIGSVVPLNMTPHVFVAKYCRQPYIFVLDEFDLLTDEMTKKLLAETIKILSDEKAPTKIVISGVSNSARALIGQHPSVVRNFATLNVPRMTDDEIKQIVISGFNKLGLQIEDMLLNLILTASHGLPYFPHLICEELSTYAIRNDKTVLDSSSFFYILNSVFVNIAEDIRCTFDQACSPMLPSYTKEYLDSTPSEIRRHVLLSIALSMNNDPIAAAKIFHFLTTEKNIFVPADYSDLTDTDISIIASEIATISDIIGLTGREICFKDAMHRGYAWLRAAHEFGEQILLRVILKQEQ
jgi:Cdc6-like AAA superfamily ATPase